MLQLLIDIALTPAVYFALHGRFGLTTTAVLLISIAAGGLWTALTLARTRKVDVVSLCVLGGIVIGGALTMLTGNPQFGVAKDSLYTGVFGLVALASLGAKRPLMYYLIRQFVADDNWASPMFRRCMRVMTLTWAVGLLIEAATRIVLVYTVSVNTAAALSPVLTGVALAVLMTWTAGYGRRAGEARRVAEA
jgi:intracellular septation protein A